MRCLKQDPGYINARFNLAIAYQTQGKYDEALAAFRKILESDPRRAPVWRNIGKIEEKRGDLLRAAEAYEKSLAIDPEQKDAIELRKSAERLRIRQIEQEAAKATAAEPAKDQETKTAEAAPAPASTPLPTPELPPAPEIPPKTVEASHVSVEPAEPHAAPETLAKLLASLLREQGKDATLLSSVPLGAEVYVSKEDIATKDPFVKYGSFGAHKKSRDYLALRRDIVDKRYLRGFTPLTLDLDEGHYQIAFRLPGQTAVYAEDGNAYAQSPDLTLAGEQLSCDIKVYEVTIRKVDRPRYVVALFQRLGQTAQEFQSACVGDCLFSFDEPEVERNLEAYGVGESERKAGLRMLACAGKALVVGDRGNLLVTLRGSGAFRVTRSR